MYSWVIKGAYVNNDYRLLRFKIIFKPKRRKENQNNGKWYVDLKKLKKW